jgi:hypothetical protein
VAGIGIDWAAAQPERCLQVAGAETRACSVLDHQPDSLDEWVRTWRTRCRGPPLALGRELHKRPLVAALRPPALLGRLPLHSRTRARARATYTPRQAQAAPTDADLQLERLRKPRDQRQPWPPQRPPMRALAPRVASRRRRVGDTVRLTPRLTRTRTHS